MQLFCLDSSANARVSTTSTVEDVAALPGAGHVRVGPAETRISLAGARVGGAEWDIDVRFNAGVITWIGLIARRPGDARGWDQWSMDQELARKAFHEEWAQRVLGARFEALRVEVDGKWISTDWPEPSPRQATFPWGQLRSVYDGHSSQAVLAMMVGFVGG